MSASISTPVGPTCGRGSGDAHSAGNDLGLDIHVGQRERMAHGNQIGGALGRLDACESRDLKRISLGIGGKCLEHCGR